MKSEDEKIILLYEANEIKERLTRLAEKLDTQGYISKAKCIMNHDCNTEEVKRRK